LAVVSCGPYSGGLGVVNGLGHIAGAFSGAPQQDSRLVDSMVHDGLWSSFLDKHMGAASDEVNKELEIGREVLAEIVSHGMSAERFAIRAPDVA